jgi:hypothetical protein
MPPTGSSVVGPAGPSPWCAAWALPSRELGELGAESAVNPSRTVISVFTDPRKDPPFCTETIPSVRSAGGAQNGIFCSIGCLMGECAVKFSSPELPGLVTMSVTAVRRTAPPTSSWLRAGPCRRGRWASSSSAPPADDSAGKLPRDVYAQVSDICPPPRSSHGSRRTTPPTCPEFAGSR